MCAAVGNVSRSGLLHLAAELHTSLRSGESCLHTPDKVAPSGRGVARKSL